MNVENVMTVNPKTISSGESLDTARRIMDMGRFRSLPVVGIDDKLIGIITNRDVLRHIDALEDIQVGLAMTPDPVSIAPETAVEDAAMIMVLRKFSALPVVEAGRVTGIVTSSDLLRAFVRVEHAIQHILED